MTRNTTQSSGVLRELLKSAQDLSAYGVVLKTDMARMKAVCAEPPEYTPWRVVSNRTRVAEMSQAFFPSFMK